MSCPNDYVPQLLLTCLSPDLLHPRYKNQTHPLAGHCYIVAEALRELLGDEWKPQFLKHEGASHWFLRHRKTGEVLDPTGVQFETPVPYQDAKGKGFLTKEPSKRARKLLERVRRKMVKEKYGTNRQRVCGQEL